MILSIKLLTINIREKLFLFRKDLLENLPQNNINKNKNNKIK